MEKIGVVLQRLQRYIGVFLVIFILILANYFLQSDPPSSSSSSSSLRPALSDHNSFLSLPTNVSHIYVTCLCEEKDLLAVEIIAEALRVVQAKYPLVVLRSHELSTSTSSLLQTTKFYWLDLPRYGAVSCPERLHFLSALPGHVEKAAYLSPHSLPKQNPDHLFDTVTVTTETKKPLVFDISTALSSSSSLVTVPSQDLITFPADHLPWKLFLQKNPHWYNRSDLNHLEHWVRLQDQVSSSSSSAWPQRGRREAICQNYSITQSFHRDYPIQDKFSILIGTFHRAELLSRAIRHFQAMGSSAVHKIYATWHNPKTEPPATFLDQFLPSPPVVLVHPQYDTLNNRFNPIDDLETAAVYICDEDMVMEKEDLMRGFKGWKKNRDAIVGFVPRHVSREVVAGGGGVKYGYNPASAFSNFQLVLTKDILRYVDQQLNCEDIAMNMLVSGLTGQPPVAIKAKTAVKDVGGVNAVKKTKGISSKKGHNHARDDCIGYFAKVLGKYTLLSSDKVV